MKTPLPQSEALTTSAPTTSLLRFVLQQLQVRTNLCSYQAGETGYTLEPRTVQDYNYIYITRGRVVWEVEKQPYELKPGSLMLVTPGVPHRGYSLTQRFTLASFHVEATLPGGRDVFDMLQLPRLQQLPAGCALDRYLRGAIADWSARPGDEARTLMRGWSRLVVFESFFHAAQAGTLRQTTGDPVLAEVMEKLNQSWQDPPSLPELARWAGYSAQHLNRVFRKVIGITPLQYAARIRMEKAAALLASRQLTVKGVGERLGIDDPYYFSRLFRQHYGVSPSQYRETAQEGMDLDTTGEL